MNKILFIILLLSSNLWANEVYKSNVKAVINKSKNYDSVVLTGKLIKQIDDDEFIFQDETGEIKVEIESYVWSHIDSNMPILNTKIRILAIVDKELFDKTELEVSRIRLLEEYNKKDPLSD
jgi:uncharacterized protein (TIGR00156 family)